MRCRKYVLNIDHRSKQSSRTCVLKLSWRERVRNKHAWIEPMSRPRMVRMLALGPWYPEFWSVSDTIVTIGVLPPQRNCYLIRKLQMQHLRQRLKPQQYFSSGRLKPNTRRLEIKPQSSVDKTLTWFKMLITKTLRLPNWKLRYRSIPQPNDQHLQGPTLLYLSSHSLSSSSV